MIIDKSNYKDFLIVDGNALDCPNKGVTEIRYLPESLIILYCENNNLTYLPELPKSLKGLYCHNNELTSLPELPNTLKELTCYDNRLTYLPELPDSLEYLNCRNNQLPIEGIYINKQEIKDYKHKMKQYILINQILEKI